MKLSDKELEILVYSALRRCPEGNDRHAAKVVVDMIIEAEVKQYSDLKVIGGSKLAGQ